MIVATSIRTSSTFSNSRAGARAWPWGFSGSRALCSPRRTIFRVSVYPPFFTRANDRSVSRRTAEPRLELGARKSDGDARAPVDLGCGAAAPDYIVLKSETFCYEIRCRAPCRATTSGPHGARPRPTRHGPMHPTRGRGTATPLAGPLARPADTLRTK